MTAPSRDWCQRLNCMNWSRWLKGRTVGVGSYFLNGEPHDAVGHLYVQFARMQLDDVDHVEQWFEEATGVDARLVAMEADSAPPGQHAAEAAALLRLRALRGIG